MASVEIEIQVGLGALPMEQERVALRQSPRLQAPFVVYRVLFMVVMFFFVYKMRQLFRFRLKINN